MYKIYATRNGAFAGEFSTLDQARAQARHLARMNIEAYYVTLHGVVVADFDYS